ncbi:MAG: hypothetical protein QF411_11190, partial [Planctomycetota bacterium]|nr:hypothetical protein [Planctomycetota bacterium]
MLPPAKSTQDTIISRITSSLLIGALLLGPGCFEGRVGGSGDGETDLEVSGGGSFTVVAGVEFQSFVTATVNDGNPVFTIADVTSPPTGPSLDNVSVDNVDHPGLVTADVPVGFGGPVTITVGVDESTASTPQL